MNGLALCAGIGGLELGVSLAEPGYRTVGYVERDPYAASCLVARMEESSLDPAPIWDDLATFDGTPWRGAVDLVTAGFPCQPFSAAGSKRGVYDHRWLWPDIERIIGEVQPGLIFLENVHGFVRRGLGAVAGGLAEMGFSAEWGHFSAAGVGAPHKRTRFFLLAAHPDRWGREELGLSEQGGFECQGGDESDGRTCPWFVQDWKAAVRRGGLPQPTIRRVDDGAAFRVDRLRCLGNGVVPRVAQRAYETLKVMLHERP